MKDEDFEKLSIEDLQKIAKNLPKEERDVINDFIIQTKQILKVLKSKE